MDIFQYDFMVRAFEAGIIIAIIAPLIGIFLVVKRYSLLADTLSHVSLVGVALGILGNINPLITALITTVIMAFGMENLRENKKIFGESVLALFLSGSLAIAIIIIGLARGLNINVLAYLFGSITTVTETDIYLIFGIGLIVLFTTVIFYRRLFLISYDEEMAAANGLAVKSYNLLLIILAAVTVSLAMRVVGILLVGALMVIPVITAMQFGRSFKQTLILSVILSLVAVVAGLFISFYFDIASGATIVLTSLILFISSLIVNK
jgi:zinc transport system permease protein